MRAWHRPLVALGLLAPACAPSSAPPAQRASTGTTAPLHPLVASDEAIQPEPATPTTTEPPAPVTTVTVSKLPPTTLGTTTTTFVVPEKADEDLTDEEWAAREGYLGDTRAVLLACIRSYESGGDYGAVSASGTYRGAYQFDRPTWSSVGGSGDPAAAPAAEQDARAWALYLSRGLQPWPTPARRCG